MPWSAPKHCPAGHSPFRGKRCPICTAACDARRPSARERGYDSKWQNARKAFLLKYPKCVGCGQPATVVDHNTPHKGDMHLFWQQSNWRPMCASCHSRKTATQDGGFGNAIIQAGEGFEF